MLPSSFSIFDARIDAPTSPRFRPYSRHNFRQIPQMSLVSEELKFAIEVVSAVLPFRVNQFVIDELIDWSAVPDDPMFRLTFPQSELLLPHHFEEVANGLRHGGERDQINQTINRIRMELNPHPAGQVEHNVPWMDGQWLTGIQHKYRETVLFFPRQGQTCHAYCTFCFRWPQFVEADKLKFGMQEASLLVEYLTRHPHVTDILFTGGDPMVMRTRQLAEYIEPILKADLPNLRTIRIGTKALTYWPHRFLDMSDSDDLLRLFERVKHHQKNLVLMAHFNHPVELTPPQTQKAIRRILTTGAQIRTQSPLLAHINDSPQNWIDMWREQVHLGMVPYYMFLARDTGAHHYFGVPIVKGWNIFREAYQQVSGICRTVRGPSMSTHPGKVHVLGVSEINQDKVFILQFLQGRNPLWVRRPFLAQYDETATWLDELQPAFSDKFFFEDELKALTSRSQVIGAEQTCAVQP